MTVRDGQKARFRAFRPYWRPHGLVEWTLIAAALGLVFVPHSYAPLVRPGWGDFDFRTGATPDEIEIVPHQVGVVSDAYFRSSSTVSTGQFGHVTTRWSGNFICNDGSPCRESCDRIRSFLESEVVPDGVESFHAPGMHAYILVESSGGLPNWLVMVLRTLYFAFPAIVATRLLAWLRQWRRIRATRLLGHCPCGYDVGDLDVCPECGARNKNPARVGGVVGPNDR